MPLSFTSPGPVASQFMASISKVQILTGPLGGGKSTCCLFKLLALALAQPVVGGVRRARFCILRNTTAQLKDTVKPLIDQWFIEAPEQAIGIWHLSDLKFKMKMQLADETIVDAEFWLMAADTVEDVRRLLSTEFSAAWIEECREINSEVFAGLQGRCGRYPSRINGGVAYPAVICSTNMPTVGSYWHSVMVDVPAGWEVFHQPPAVLEDLSPNPARENPFLPDSYYDDLVSGKTEEWLKVFLKCQYGTDVAGLPVYKSSFNRNMHLAKATFEPLRSKAYPIIVGLDNGLQAAAVMLQNNVRGRLIALGECFVPDGTTMGVERFLDNFLIPKLRNEYHGCEIIFNMDPACDQRQQRDERTIAQAVRERGYRAQTAVTNDTEKRISAVEQVFVKQIDGDGLLQINPECKHLLAACEYGYMYAARRDGTPNTTNDPVKNIFSHISDALQYGIMFYNAPQRSQRTQARVIKPATYHWS